MLELQDWRAFSITSWYKLFEHDVMRSIIIEIPEDILSYIEENNGRNQKTYSDESIVPIQNALNELNQNAFVRNNWRSPQDAKAFSFGNTLKVTSIDDILLYLSVSDRISRDFESSKGIPFCLVLRPWVNIHPASEFRCIVVNKVLRGISPRDWPTYYAHYKEDGPRIIEKIHTFYKYKMSHFPRRNFICDIILTLPDEPVIVDFSPLNSHTNLLAFKWREIHRIIIKNSDEEVPPVFRYLESDIGILARVSPYQKYSSSE